MLYKFDSVSALKQEICKKVHVVEYCVDLQGHSLPLLDEESLQICRIRDGDLVQATILRHRIRVKIHISGYALVNVMVDDSCDTTVGGLKEFVHSQLERQPGTQQVETTSASGEVTGHSDVDLTVIYRGNALPDGVTLAEAGVVMDAKLQVVTIEKLCYTAAAVSGSFPIFFCNQDGGLIRRRTAMSNGEKIFLDPWDIHTPADERGDNNIVTNVCRNRRPMPSGVRLCSKKDFQLLSCQSLQHSRAKANETAKQGHGGCPRSFGIPTTSTAATTSRDTPEPGAVQSSRKRKSNGEITETSTAMPDPCSSQTSVGPSCSGTLPPERVTAGVLLSDCVSSLATWNTDDVVPFKQEFFGDMTNARPNQIIQERLTPALESLDSGTDKTGCTRQMSSIMDSLSSCVSELESELETSGSETIISRRKMAKDVNGRVVSEQLFFKKSSISPDLIQLFEGSASFQFQNPVFPGLPSTVHLPCASLPADASATESVFAYISKDIIHCVATQLEGDGNLMVFSTLGLQ
ncbi:hypothetical protein V1264_002537 [Littorina saxatilis]|uniref:Uncharacterized protein n=1 Tax=Littorina saxatilis TaxID=31220 RepID=A0AAN9B664_9CAEN